MTQAETARKYFETARQEAVQRATLRDGVMLAFMAAAAALFAVFFDSLASPGPAASPGATTASPAMPTDQVLILLIVPFLALGATLIAVHHSAVVEGLGRFVAGEHQPFMQALNEQAPNMESSKALAEYGPLFLWLTSIAHTLIVAVPSATALWLTGGWASPSRQIKAVWWVGLLAAVAAIAAVWWVHQFRAGRKTTAKHWQLSPTDAASTYGLAQGKPQLDLEQYLQDTERLCAAIEKLRGTLAGPETRIETGKGKQ